MKYFLIYLVEDLFSFGFPRLRKWSFEDENFKKLMFIFAGYKDLTLLCPVPCFILPCLSRAG